VAAADRQIHLQVEFAAFILYSTTVDPLNADIYSPLLLVCRIEWQIVVGRAVAKVLVIDDEAIVCNAVAESFRDGLRVGSI
jgi:hypothetical protein